jgi:hypothetical protein
MKLVPLLCALLLATSSDLLAQAKWHTDYAKAAAEATKARKDLLVLVHDPKNDDCKAYAAAVADQPEFTKAVSTRHVLVRIAPSKMAQLANLADVKLEAVPALVLVLPEGDPYSVMEYSASRLGKQREAAGPWRETTEALDLLETRRELHRGLAVSSVELAARHAAAAADLRWTAWDACAKALEDSPAALWPLPHAPLARVVRAALAEDPDNQAGKSQRALKLLLSLDMASEADLATVPRIDAENQLGLLELKLSVDIQRRVKQMVEASKQMRQMRAAQGEAETIRMLESMCSTIESSLVELDAFRAKPGFRDPKVGFQQYHALAAGAWFTFKLLPMVARDKQAPKELREAAERAVERMGKSARQAAEAARAFGIEEEGPLKVLDDILGAR